MSEQVSDWPVAELFAEQFNLIELLREFIGSSLSRENERLKWKPALIKNLNLCQWISLSLGTFQKRNERIERKTDY